MPDQTPEPLTSRKPSPFSDEELKEFATGLATASNPYAAVQDLSTELLAANARIDELSAGQGDLITKLSKASARIAELEDERDESRRDAGRAVGEAGATTPDAYIAARRVFAGVAKWYRTAWVIPSLEHPDPDHYRSQGYELLPIVADRKGALAVGGHAEPVGYVVGDEESDSRGCIPLYVDEAYGHREEAQARVDEIAAKPHGFRTAVYALLREVRDA